MQDGIFTELWAWLKTDPIIIAISGAAGGAVRAVALRERFWQAISSIAVGLICAEYLAQAAVPYMPEKTSPTTTGFLIGIAGIALVGFVLDFVKFYRKGREGRP